MPRRDKWKNIPEAQIASPIMVTPLQNIRDKFI